MHDLILQKLAWSHMLGIATKQWKFSSGKIFSSRPSLGLKRSNHQLAGSFELGKNVRIQQILSIILKQLLIQAVLHILFLQIVFCCFGNWKLLHQSIVQLGIFVFSFIEKIREFCNILRLFKGEGLAKTPEILPCLLVQLDIEAKISLKVCCWRSSGLITCLLFSFL